MRRTLTVLVASAALLVPATAASAEVGPGYNASCNSGKQVAGTSWNGQGHGNGCTSTGGGAGLVG